MQSRVQCEGSNLRLAGAALLCCLAVTACATQAEPVAPSPAERADAGSRELYPVTIRKPDGPPRVDTGRVDVNGERVTASCASCHTNREANLENRRVEDLEEFHGSLKFTHGQLSCHSCHNPEDYSSLRLADLTRVEYPEVMDLCAQCHGPQMRDYTHGAHGGMNGFWDRSRGPQYKNNCIDCHDPHVPQFPKMQPTFKPRDRFLTAAHHDDGGDSH